MRIAAYARYSTDMQRLASLEDQLRNCRNYCERQGWPVPTPYTDAAVSGSRKDRPEYNRLLTEAKAGLYDAIIVDDLTRLSRDSIETQQQVRELKYHNVRIIGVSDGVDTGRKNHVLDVGLRGLMGELYITDLADKTHRGLTGRALLGRSAGGLGYGYRVTEIGLREIVPNEAEVIRGIFSDYLSGVSPRRIARNLNERGVPSPRGGTWAVSAIFGDIRRGIGVLANQMYVGKQIWNRSCWIKNPDTGRRTRRERPKEEWIESYHSELQIIDSATFEAAQKKLGPIRVKSPEADPRAISCPDSYVARNAADRSW